MNRQYVEHDPAIRQLLRMPADQPVLLLHSGRFHERWARRSVMARPRGWYRCWADGRFEISDFGFGIADLTGNLWRDLRWLLHDERLGGRWIGYFGYDVCRVIEREKLTAMRGDGPIVELAWCPEVEKFEAISDFGFRISDRQSAIRNPQSAIHSNFTRDQYEASVQRVIDYIAAGDVFQVNLSQQLQAECPRKLNPRKLFARLAGISPAWYGAYLELPDERYVLSTSPELFLQVENGHVITRPIKGTRPGRGQLIAPAVRELRDSEKDIAELNMIVDLMRNDLGKVCAYGSVKVTTPREIETHPTIHHGVATVEGELHPRKDVVDLLRATLPGGSITGAPKVRAMQIIDELEQCSRGVYCGAIGWLTKDACQLNVAIRTMTMERMPGVALSLPPMGGVGGGYVRSRHRAADSRCAEFERTPTRPPPMGEEKETSDIRHPTYRITFPVGGGIVADSDPADEYDETIDKAQAMLRALDASGGGGD